MSEILVSRGEACQRNADNVDWLALLDKQIQHHKNFEQSQSILSRAVLEASRVAWTEDSDALAKMESLKKRVEQERQRGDDATISLAESEIPDAINSDRKALRSASQIEGLGGNFLKSVALFFPGRFGRIASVATYSMAQTGVSDNLTTQMCDGVLGSLKGGLMHSSFSKLGSIQIGIPGKGVLMGTTSRFVELGLDRSTFINDETGKFNFANGAGKLLDSTLNPTALGLDVAVFGLSHGLNRSISSVTRASLESRPLLATCLTANSFGMTIGAFDEWRRQRQEGENLQLTRVLERAVVQGSLDTIAAIPGGLKNDAAMRRTAHQFVSEQFANARRTGDTLISRLDEYMSSNAGPKLAFAGVANDGRNTSGIGKPRFAMMASELHSVSDLGAQRQDANSSIAERAESLRSAREKAMPVSRGRLEPVEKLSAANASLDLPGIQPVSLERLGERISGVRESNLKFWRQRSGVEGPFKDFDDFSMRGIVQDSEPTPTVVYKLDGHPAEVIVEQNYDSQLDAVRSYRIMKERGWSGSQVAAMREFGLAPEMALRALPEDIAPLLDRLPDSSLIKRVVLSNERNPQDGFNQQRYGQLQFESSATASPDGTVIVYKGDLNEFLNRDVSHEWAHLLKFRCPQEGKLFDIASNFESDITNFTSRTTRIDPDERWATALGEEFLHPSSERFLTFMQKSPLSSLILSKALRVVLEPLPADSLTPYQQVVLQRIDLAEQLARPQAAEKVAFLLSGFSPLQGEQLSSGLGIR